MLFPRVSLDALAAVWRDQEVRPFDRVLCADKGSKDLEVRRG